MGLSWSHDLSHEFDGLTYVFFLIFFLVIFFLISSFKIGLIKNYVS